MVDSEQFADSALSDAGGRQSLVFTLDLVGTASLEI